MNSFYLDPFLGGGFYFVQKKWSAPGLPLSSKKQVNWSSSPFKASPSNTSSGVPGVSVWDKFEETQILENIFSHSTVIEEELERSMIKSLP